MENLDELVKKARELLQEMGDVLATLNTGSVVESDNNTTLIEIGLSIDEWQL
jgi:hypothetical protein